MSALFKCELDTRHFSFAAYGETAEEAREAFRAGLIRHKGAPSTWIDEACEDANVSQIVAGTCYRDGVEI